MFRIEKLIGMDWKLAAYCTKEADAQRQKDLMVARGEVAGDLRIREADVTDEDAADLI